MDEEEDDLAEYIGGSYDPRGEQAQQWQRDVAGIPLIGGLSGADAAMQREREANERGQRLGMISQLLSGAPGEEELSQSYADEWGSLLGPESQLENYGPSSSSQGDYLQALRSLYESGGYHPADRAQSQAMRAQQAQQMGAANQAALSSLASRGMAGGGAELAARLQGSQSMTMANQQSDAAIQQAAMQRALGALQGYGQQANQMYSQEAQRRQALDAFNQQNTGWRREREQSRVAGKQQAFQNREKTVALATGQYGGGDAARREDAASNQQSGLIGGILEALVS
jgi:hypothetical protein